MKKYEFTIKRNFVGKVEDNYSVRAESLVEAKEIFMEALAKAEEMRFHDFTQEVGDRDYDSICEVYAEDSLDSWMTVDMEDSEDKKFNLSYDWCTGNCDKCSEESCHSYNVLSDECEEE